MCNLNRVVIFLAGLIVTLSIYAAPKTWSDSESAYTSVVVVSENISSPDESHHIPVIYKSSNEGLNWLRNEVKSAQGKIRSISCVGKSNCVGVGELYKSSTTNLIAYQSNDGGNSWVAHNLGVYGGPSGLDSVTCNVNQHCIAVGTATPVNKGGAQPIVFTSVDNGNTWVPNYPEPLDVWPSSSGLSAVSCSGKDSLNCLAIGVHHQYKTTSTTFVSYSSTDGGFHWTRQIIDSDPATESTLISVSCNDDGQYCVAAGYLSLNYAYHPANFNNQPVIYETKDAGKTWVRPGLPFESSANATLNEVRCFAKSCIAVGSQNGHPVVIKREDSSWIRIPIEDNYSVNAIPITGLNVDLRFNFSASIGHLTSVKCDDAGISCTAVGYTRYIINLKNGTRVYAILPLVYFSSDTGNYWKQIWPNLLDDLGNAHTVETVAIDISATS